MKNMDELSLVILGFCIKDIARLKKYQISHELWNIEEFTWYHSIEHAKMHKNLWFIMIMSQSEHILLYKYRYL